MGRAPGEWRRRSGAVMVRERLQARRWSTRNRTLAWLIALVLCLPLATASASAPPPLPQSSTGKTFAAGSYIIDAGWMGTSTTTQPKTSLQTYGLIYQLLVNKKIPVYWIIANEKTGTAGSAPSLTNTTADLTNVSVYTPYTATSADHEVVLLGPLRDPGRLPERHHAGRDSHSRGPDRRCGSTRPPPSSRPPSSTRSPTGRRPRWTPRTGTSRRASTSTPRSPRRSTRTTGWRRANSPAARTSS